jgi:plasmid stabilization system protein ParE
MKVNVRPLFYLDLAEEVAFLAEQAGAEIARRWAEAVWDTVTELEAFPRLGRERTDLPFHGIRSWRVREFTRWLIFYGVRDSVLILYRVRHGAVNLLRLDYNS